MLPTAFSKTLRALSASRPRAAFVRLTGSMLLLALLGCWMAWVPVTLLETSSDARLEIDSSAASVQSDIAGKVVACDLALGKTVKAGDVLVRLDSVSEELQARQEETRITA